MNITSYYHQSSRSIARCARFAAACAPVLATLAMLPGVASAMSVDDIIQAAKAGNGTVVETHSSASTGGQRASGGQTISTGDVSASSHVETRINANDGGGTVEVKVEKTENGVTTEEEYTEHVEPDEAVRVHVDVEASSETENDGVSAAHESEAEVIVTHEEPGFFTDTVPHFFKKVLSFFIWF